MGNEGDKSSLLFIYRKRRLTRVRTTQVAVNSATIESALPGCVRFYDTWETVNFNFIPFRNFEANSCFSDFSISNKPFDFTGAGPFASVARLFTLRLAQN